MDGLRKEDGWTPSVLDQPQIAEIARRAITCRDVVATFILALALTPFDPSPFAASRVAGFDAARASIAMPNARGDRCRVGLGRAACATLSLAAAGRTKGFLFADAHGDAIWADRDAEDHANELLSFVGEAPLPFRFTFRSLREGVFANMADGGVRQDVALSLAGLGRPATGPAEAAFSQSEQRDASDWWAGEIGVVVGRTPRGSLRIGTGASSPARPRQGGAAS